MFNYKIGTLVALSAFFFVYIHSTGIGSVCFLPSDCETNKNYFVCENGVCKCNKTHIPDKENIGCAVDILKNCTSEDKCYDTHAECVGYWSDHPGKCLCKNGYTLHELKKVCSIIIGNDCSTTDECIEGTCNLPEAGNHTQCLCNEPLQSNINGTKCLPALNDDCSTFNKCAKENAVCNDTNICVCDVNYKEAPMRDVCDDEETPIIDVNNTTTYCLAMLDNKCNNTVDCADYGADCIEKNETSNELPVCRKPTDDVWTPSPPPKPIEKYCECRKDYVRNPDVSECLEVVTGYNESCVHNIQCSAYLGIGSECIEGNCLCKPDFYLDVDFNRCVRSCVCDKQQEIISILKELVPAFKELANNNNNIHISGVLNKIENLSH